MYDACLFFNELDLLEIRLNILDSSVDYFVIVESDETFTGIPKPLFFAENQGRFEPWRHKIIHHVVRNTPSSQSDVRSRLKSGDVTEAERRLLEKVLAAPSLPLELAFWVREFYQRESINHALETVSGSGFCFLSDADEIWSPFASVPLDWEPIFRFEQKMYTYFLNNRTSEKWVGTVATDLRTVRESSINALRQQSRKKRNRSKNGGWHFTNMGGAASIISKIEAYAHQEINTDKVKSSLAEKISANKDFIGRRYRLWVDDTDLPQFLLDNRQRYEALFKL